MSIAGLGDGAPLHPVSTGMFARHQSAVAHQLARTWEAGEAAEFADDGSRRHLGYASQSLQRFDHGADLRTGLGNGFIDGLLQLENPLGGVVDFLEIMRQRGLQRGLIEMHMRPDPLQILLGPSFAGIGRALAVPEEKLTQPMACTELIFFSCFPPSANWLAEAKLLLRAL